MDRTLALKAAGTQLVVVGVLALIMGLALPHSFFVDWGWIAGPAAWMLAATITARVLTLDLGRALVGAALAGIPSALATLTGLHWLEALIAIALFGAWCGHTRTTTPQPA